MKYLLQYLAMREKVNIISFFRLACCLLFFSCKHDNLLVPKPNENIRPAADFIKNNYDFKLLYAALEYTGLVQELNGSGPFTILAVGDKGFNALGIYTVADVQRLNKDSLRQALRYHVLNRRLLTSDIPTNGVDVRYETLAGKELYASAITPNGNFYFDGSMLTRSNITLANGVLHVLVKMMQYHQGVTVQDFLASRPQYSIYVAGLKKFGLWDELAQPGPFTIFAPNNQAFAGNGITVEQISGLNTNNYNGGRLFGAYIMYGKHYFISDKYIFYQTGGEYSYSNKLRNDDWYLNFTTYDTWTTGDTQVYLSYPELNVGRPDPNSPGSYLLVGRVDQVYSNLRPLESYDHLCENGVVHDLHGLLVLPEQAAK